MCALQATTGSQSVEVAERAVGEASTVPEETRSWILERADARSQRAESEKMAASPRRVTVIALEGRCLAWSAGIPCQGEQTVTHRERWARPGRP